MLQMTVRPTPFLARSMPFRFFFFFFVLSVARSSGGGEAKSERTLAIIKPDGLFGNHTDAVKKIILESGFRILKEKIVQLDQESAASFYAEHSARSFFHSLVQYMTSGPVLVMVLEKDDAVSSWRTLIGPTDASKAKITHPQSIRAMCGTDAEKNCVHGSDSPQSAQREISFFFDSMPSAGVQAIEHDEL
ncbi:probable nucleoside diphosphate kinase 5 isoform X1 [Eucalyptus grandis]|uniref:probable nucleoside diphosphate kinase 5 isoform X1 n=2 Tax=Eucalyptus grandis TaxID=71139 RepID=UPI000524C34C|nr:probable nucleoside diphosphate kinase 5 isoform X1 [Eucalyptus grandis]